MNRFFYIILFLLLAHSLCAQVTMEEITQTYYISSSTGNDQNDGLSPETALRTIKALPTANKICIRLKCGDVFFEQIKNFNRCIVESYGKGQKPVLCGFKILRNVNAWTLDATTGCWVLDLNKEEDFAGFLTGREGYEEVRNNIGLIYDAMNDKVYGHNVKSKSLLKNEYDFFTNEHYAKDSVLVHPFKKLYWKTTADPRRMGTLCFSMPVHGVTKSSRMVIRNIAIVGFAYHGIADGSYNDIENCQIDMIGGGIQVGYKRWARFGNGIEFTARNKNNTVTNCLISRTYDCGTTIQGYTSAELFPTNIHFSNNRFYHCRQAFEHFIRPIADETPYYSDCSFHDNLCLYMGENEFNSAEKRDANILSYESLPQKLDIYGNTFFGAPLLCSQIFGEGTCDNLVYIFKGQYLNHYHGTSNYPTIYANDSNDIKAYSERALDNSKIIILEKDSKKALKMEKEIRKKIAWKCLNLNLDKWL